MTYSRTPARSAANRRTPEPFWQRLRQIALYPVRGGAVFYLIALTVCSLFGMIPVVGRMIMVATWATAYKYSFDILRASADGRTEPPEGLLDTDNGTLWRLMVLQIFYFGAVLLGFAFGGPIIGIVMLLFAALMLPGCLMSLAIDGSLQRALNPAVPLGIINRVGWPYLAVFALTFVIQASAATAGSWLTELMPPILGELALTFFSFWAMFSVFHLMGYLVYQFHDELGYEPQHRDHSMPDLHNPDARLLGEVETHVRNGQPAAAIELLRMELRTRAVGVETHELYHRLLRQHGDRAAVSEHARQYLNLLMLEKRERQALALLRSALDLDPAFVPLLDEQIGLLAQRARDMGQTQLAADLLRAGLRSRPRHDDAARWGLDAALLLADRLGRDADARETLEAARAVCTDDAVRDRIDSTLQLLRTLPA